MEDYTANIAKLRQKLERKRGRVMLRYGFYEMKNHAFDFQISTPPNLKHWNSCLGWCTKAVDSLADRLQFREFRNDNYDVQEIFDVNNPDVLFDSAVLSALISSCCFVYISVDENNYPRLQVIDGGNATGNIDPITHMLTEGYAVLERNKDLVPTVEAYFTADATYILQNNEVEEYAHNAGHPLLVPIIFRPDAVRPFGHSRISRACMNIMGSALRTIKRSEISAEFYSFPQKYVTGLSEDSELLGNWNAAMSSMMSFTKDEDGDSPSIGQFAQQSMAPHIEQLKMFASAFAGETGLTLDDLGFATANPASAEAIKASHENLRLTARKAQREFGSNFLNVAYLAACIRDDFKYSRDMFVKTIPIWEPVFEPDASALSVIGDGAIKINQAIPGYFNDTNLHDLTGIAAGDYE